MAAPRGNSEPIGSLVAALAGKNGLARQRARWVLVEIGGPAAGPLVKALSDPRARVRWEAAKALTNIHDSSTVPALIAALEDKDDGVAWLAAEALIAQGADALVPLLTSLTVRPDCPVLREAAHHVLKAQRAPDLLGVLGPVLEALWHLDPEEAVPVAADRALGELRKRSGTRQRRTYSRLAIPSPGRRPSSLRVHGRFGRWHGGQPGKDTAR